MKVYAKVFWGLLVIWFSVQAQSQTDTVPVPFDSLMDYRVSVDGYIDAEDNEYPASFRDPATGVTVYWGHDDSLVYVGMEAKGKGWLAIGFGSPVMNGSNMIIGLYSDDSLAVFNHIGGERGHRAVSGDIGLIEDWEIDYDDETNTLALEFVYPLRWQGLSGTAVKSLDPGNVYDFILARNPRGISLKAKHAQKSRGFLKIEPGPISKDSTTVPER
ncbi:MAG: hypothetical protein N2248_06620 [candidate division WOR-3 bacterium]|uniref:DOMON domain-containing protein n=1 Tax=candidate division WOR-3 bacterium TaxID=2052148 RepID=A0A7C3ELR5_UNCW3|nr:hypothetical protein [candidate division WOR-3 bacterium]